MPDDTGPPLLRRTRSVMIAVACGAFALAGALVTLAGWLLDVPRLANWRGDGVAMMPNAALAAACAGVAVLLLTLGMRRTGTGLAVVTSAIGTATLMEHLTGVDFGIDMLLLYREWGQAGTVSPGRMGVPGSTSFAILGAAIAMTAFGPRTRRWSIIGGCVAMSIATLSIVGYLFGADRLYAVPSLTTVALHTATIVLALGIGVVALVPERRPIRFLLEDSAAGLLVRRALPVILFLPVILGWLRLRGEEAGLFEMRFGTALLVLLLMLLLTLFLLRAAAAVSAHEERLRQSGERLEGLLSGISDQFQSVDGEWRFTYHNDAMRRSLAEQGVDADATLGRSMFEVFPDFAGTPAAGALRRAMADRVDVECETFYPAWRRWYLVRASPTPDGGLALLSQDITARKEVERTAAEHERHLRLITDHAPVMIAHCDAELRYKFVNLPYAERFGVETDAVVGRRIPEVVGEAAFASFQHHVETALAGQAVEFELEIPYRIGPQFMRVAYAPERDAEGRVVGLVAAIMNITEGKRAALQLAEANRRKDEFLATLAHELRNPLAPIVNSIELMKQVPFDSVLVTNARVLMERQAAQMARLIDDLIDISRISRGTIDLRRERVDLVTVVGHALDASRALMDTRRQVLTVTLPPRPVMLMADPVRLAQVFGNLLNNAGKYTDEGGCITVEAAVEGDQAVVTVQDSGIGIEPDMLSGIFELFVRADHALERSHGGLGVGLTLVRQLVEAHGGSVTAASDGLGKGSTFIARLPVLREVPDESARTVPGRNGVVLPRRVLVVDDNRDAAMTLTMLLTALGHEATTAYNGEEALAVGSGFGPDVVFLDIGMPQMNGYDVARAMRTTPWGKAAFLVALTGWGADEDRRRSKDAGFDAHLVKPITPTVLDEVLGGRH